MRVSFLSYVAPTQMEHFFVVLRKILLNVILYISSHFTCLPRIALIFLGATIY